MFSLFRKKTKERSCINCKYYKKGRNPRCTVTNSTTLKSFPFSNTKCKTYKQR